MANQISVNTGSGAGAQQVIVDSNGNITVTVSRSVIGTVANVASANYANFAGTVITAAQPNITSVGNLTSLNVTGTTTTGNLVVLGNLQVGNLVANTANYANFAGTAFAVAGANVSGTVANATYAATAGFATTAGSANTANTATVANSANAVAGANVSGTVANAAYADNAGNANFANSATVASSANSVTLANVSGAGNIASINLDGNVSNVLKGDGTFGPEGSTGNANYANFAGNAFSVDGGNVVGAVANATFALDAGNANIANIAYSVDVANVSGIGNIATINLDGNVANALLGDGTFGAVELTTANYANFAGDVVNSVQPNITSVGNLTSLTVTGNTNANTINYSNAIVYNGSATTEKIIVQADLAGAATVRNLSLRGGNISNALVSNTTAGAVILNGGSATSTDAGNVFIARSGGVSCIAGTANTANGAAFGGGGGFQAGAAFTLLGNAIGGGFNLINGAGNSSNGNATSGSIQIGLNLANTTNGNATSGEVRIGLMSGTATNGNVGGGNFNFIAANARTITSGTANAGSMTMIAGNARSENGNATSGGITIATASAIANVGTGTATVGSISINTGTANGITANVLGNINIGTNNNSNAVNIGASNTPVNVAGNLTANNANITNNVSANNANITSNLTANIVNATYLYGDGSNISNINVPTPNSIQNGNSIVNFSGPDGELNISTSNITNGVQVNGRQLQLNGANTVGNISTINLINGALNWTLDNTQFGGGTPFGMNRYITGFMDPMNYYTARGNLSSPADVQTNDTAFNERVQVRYDGTTHTILNTDVNVLSFSPSNTVAASYTISSNDDQANSVFQVNFGSANFAGNISATNLGNIASINLDGNVSNLLTGNGTFVAIPTDVANANYANFAGDVVNSAQPNITSVGTLTALDANTSTPINITSTNGNVSLRTLNNSNTAGRRVAFAYDNPVTNSTVVFGADEAGFGYYMANTAPGNVGTGNIRSYWQFLTDGTFRHTVGGTGNIIAKNLLLGNIFTGQFNGNIVAGTGNLGIGNINAISSVNGNTFTATASINARNGSFTGVNGGAIQTNINNVVNCPDITFNRYDNNANINNYSVYRTRGTNTSPTSVQPGDTLFSIYNSAYSNVGFEYSPTSTYTTVVDTNDGAGNITVTSSYSASVPTGSTFNINYGETQTLGNINVASGNVVLNTDGNVNLANIITSAGQMTIATDNDTVPGILYANVSQMYLGGSNGTILPSVSVLSANGTDEFIVGTWSNTYLYMTDSTPAFNFNINGSNVATIDANGFTTTGRLDYLRTYGDFYSNVSQTNPNVANVNLMTFNNTGIADGISIVSNSQMTIARAGNYNIQFSAQLSQTSGGSEEAYIWLRKNGSDIPYTAGETVIAGNGDKIMAAWNYVVTANVNDYFELAWHATDTSVILESVAPTGLVPGIASVIATVTPVGA